MYVHSTIENVENISLIVRLNHLHKMISIASEKKSEKSPFWMRKNILQHIYYFIMIREKNYKKIQFHFKSDRIKKIIKIV